ncbi:hypothetical protein [Streptomyces sp. NPDC095817]|uniref:hypothetical protein n=1 Tax=Streptomyces sp. NPDC095817 TaxID=3155082 RepID=UPI00333219E3
MWSSEDKARDTVRRQGRGLSAGQLAEKVAEAVVRVRETRQQAASFAGKGEYGGDPVELALLWQARLTEWERVAAVVELAGHRAYAPGQDREGSLWAEEREQRRMEALARHEGWIAQRQDEEELGVGLWLSGDVSGRLRIMAARADLTPDQVVAQLAEYARMNDDGLVAVEPFLPR